MTKPLKPFSIDHFLRYTSQIVLDTGDYWRLESFQAEIVESLLAGTAEVWIILPTSNAKTSLLAGVALYYADYSPLPWIPIGASTREQAEILAQQAYQMIRASPGMQSRFRIFEGYRRIQPIRPDHPGRGNRGIKVHAADAGTGDGVIPFPLAILDEGHRHPDLRLYRLWKGKLGKRGGQIVMASTAGEPGGEFEQARDKIRDSAHKRSRVGAHLCSCSRDIVMHEWQVQNAALITDMEAVKAANPLAAITTEMLAADFESPTMDLGDWSRYKCNIPSRSSAAAISETEWDEAFSEEVVVDGAHIDLGVDVAWKHDTFAIVPLLAGEGYRLLGDAVILTPPRDGSTLHPDEVKIAFESLFDRYLVDTVVMDLGRAEDVASWLEDEKRATVIDWSQGNAQAADDFEAFMTGLRNGTLKHTGDSGLRAHVMHAVAHPLPGDKRRFDRPSQSRGKRRQDERVIDALTAAAMVNSYASSPAAGGTVLAGEIGDYRIEAFG
jgi:phage terminase large subunit-like protein